MQWGKRKYLYSSALSNGMRNHMREERKEETRQEVRKRNRIEERRRILQTELPEIYKKSYDEEMSMIYSNPSTVNVTPNRSRAGSLNSLTGSQVPTLPPLISSRASFSYGSKREEFHNANLRDSFGSISGIRESSAEYRAALGSSSNDTDSNTKTSDPKRKGSSAYKMRPYLEKYLDRFSQRRKTQANIRDDSEMHMMDV